MAQQMIDKEASFSANLIANEKLLEVSLTQNVRITVKKIRSSDVAIIVQDELNSSLVDAKVLKSIYPHMESIMLLVSIVEGL